MGGGVERKVLFVEEGRSGFSSFLSKITANEMGGNSAKGDPSVQFT